MPTARLASARPVIPVGEAFQPLRGHDRSTNAMNRQLPRTRRMDQKRGILHDFDAGDYTATVELVGSIEGWLAAVPVARNIDAAEMLAGRSVALLQFEAGNPGSAVVVAVWT